MPATDYQKSGRLLVVEDDYYVGQELREVICRSFPAARVDLASTAVDAITFVKNLVSASDSYSVAVLDDRIPPERGFRAETIDAVCGLLAPLMPRCHVIHTTAFAESEEFQRHILEHGQPGAPLPIVVQKTASDWVPKLLEYVAFGLDAQGQGTGLILPKNELLLLPPIPVAVVGVWRNIIARIAEGRQDLHDLDWREFEDLVAELLEEYGWSTTPMGYTKDNGIDIIAVRSVDPDIPISMMVQCKKQRASRPVKVSVVREVWSVKSENAFHQAMIATTSSFTKGAKLQAHKWRMDLKDHNAIVNWCRRIAGVPLR